MCFVDLKKAFDLVPREARLMKVQEALGTGRMDRYLRDMYANPKTRVQGEKHTGNAAREASAGCPISPILFNTFINDALEGKEELGGTVPGSKEKYTRFSLQMT
ncbi:MAG: uncharacterized protein A8A55_2670 [Amphiamblys sp. WSBS2006]|nr:MAG: uncharacterized protein A8A55_2670 [Amphiamblys sp. WSBS2006]